MLLPDPVIRLFVLPSFIILFIYDCCRYGDKVPKANVSKAFAIVWILTGLVMMGILSGALTTAITIFVFESDIILFGTKVGLGHHKRSKTLLRFLCVRTGTISSVAWLNHSTY